MSSLTYQISFGGENMEGVLIPAGSFLMGSNKGLPLEQPVHRVEIDAPFQMGKFPVTQPQWKAVMGTNPSEFSGRNDLPVENVSWEDCQLFCATLSRTTGLVVRLPSECEWEYACRAGSTTEFFFGDSEEELSNYASFDLNSRECTHPVGQKLPNAWGLFDMTGNVWEWCADVWKSDYVGAPTDGHAYTGDSGEQPRRVLRGGAWSYDAFRCRSAYRSRDWKSYRASDVGFRVVWTGIA